MEIRNIKLSKFRNYNYADINFYSGVNVIYGENGQGKTNLLEAIHICSCGRSHRTSKDSDLIKLGEEGYYISLELKSDSIYPLIEVLLRKNDNKRIRINKTPIKKMGQLMGVLKTVMFSPEDLLIIKEGPSFRRRLLDIFISQIRPAYFYDIQRYMKILANRNRLLKEINEKPSLKETLPVWNAELARTGSLIICMRNEFLRLLSSYAGLRHKQISNNQESINIVYRPSVKCDDLDNREKIERQFLAALDKNYELEIIKGTTLSGPQRDDFDIILNDNDIKVFGSQGQQRTAVLSLKMAQIDIMKEQTGESPVLLLDDVTSELDLLRQNYLMDNLAGFQTFITTTDETVFKNIKDSEIHFYKVENGNIREG